MSQDSPLPEIDGHYPLSESMLVSFREHGHIVLKQVMTRAEIDAFRPALCHSVHGARTTLSSAEKYQGGSALKLTFDLQQIEPSVRTFVHAPRLARIAAELLDVAGVRLFHYHGYFKPPGGYGTAWHRDCYYIPLLTSNFITAWIPLVEVTREMGTMTFASQSHTDHLMIRRDDRGSLQDQLSQHIRDRRYALSQCGTMQPGDISFHHCRTLHCAPQNTSARMREVMTIGYYEDGALVGDTELPDEIRGDVSGLGFRQNLLARYFPGQERGHLARGPLNPILYQSNT